MKKYCVTISRQFGSLGRPIGMKVAELLGVNFYDRDIVEEAAKRMNLPLAEASDLEESGGHIGFSYMRYPLGRSNSETKEKLFEIQASIIRETAAKESCVIVGRCSDYLLYGEPDHLNFFIYAPFDDRVKNCIEDLGIERSKAIKMINDVDKARDAYHKRYTRYPQCNMIYNDFMINSSTLGTEGTAKAIAAIARDRFQLEQ